MRALVLVMAMAGVARAGLGEELEAQWEAGDYAGVVARLEAAPGIKDHAKIKALFEALRLPDRRLDDEA